MYLNGHAHSHQRAAVARRGEVFEVRTMMAHPMETGYRPGADGKMPAARHRPALQAAPTTANRYSRPTCTSAIAANPYLAFHTVCTAPAR
jgi:sulfur-oxidizing protein SoxZ